MKARLIYVYDEYRLLLATGKITTLSLSQACQFLLKYDDWHLYSGPGKWDHEGCTIESYPGKTIAYVDFRNTQLHITNADLFRKLIAAWKDEKMLTAAEYADLHGKSRVIVRRLCNQGRIPGAILKGNQWLVPESATYPADERLSENKE